MLAPDELRKAFKRVEEENWAFRAFLKATEPDDLDRVVNEWHKTLFAEMDCRSCQNCCNSMTPALTKNDVVRIARVCGVTFDDFRDKYLKEDGGEWIVNGKSCPFLTNDGCSIYDYRPKACREYPYTNKKETSSRLMSLVANCAVCPVVFEIFEKLKKRY